MKNLTRRLCAVVIFVLGVVALAKDWSVFSNQVGSAHECPPPSRVTDPAPPLNFPDKYAWELFVQVNRKAPIQHTFTGKNGREVTTHSALWETWADDPWTFPENPDPNHPPQWPDDQLLLKTLLIPGKGGPHGEPPSPTFILDTGGEEVHRNRATFEYIINNNLWYTQGVAAYFASSKKIDFPIDSIEVKGNWVPITPDQKPKYHWNYDREGNLYGLVAMHISSKALPNWFWCTFEWVDNPGRCDYIGCHDCFGVTPHHLPSRTNDVGKPYPAGRLTGALLELFEKGGLTGDWGHEWQNYRLKGSQVDFTDPTGVPLLLGNSVTEGGFVQTASCMTCHARAAVDSSGNSAFPIFGEPPGLPLESQTPEQFQTQFTTYHGVPDPNWYYLFTGQGRTLVNLQTDFVWAIPFRAKPAKQN